MSEETNEILDEANEEVSQQVGDIMSLEEYLDELIENPSIASHSGQYILQAIKYAGKRTVIEQGEELERWRFFDDPWNDGEHAVLGNTKILNRFVNDLEQLSTEFGRDNQMMWFEGPTATGKSELKRCLINGLKEYSKTEEGKRYTIEWNITNSPDSSRIGNSNSSPNSRNWYESPVQSNPLSVLPPKARRRYIDLIQEKTDNKLFVDLELDPFSQEAYNFLAREYAEEEDVFSRITDKSHLRVRRYTMDIGKGIGVLHSEDKSERPKDLLIGSWMPSLLQQLDSQGRKDPRAFNYDGLVAQGNSGISIIEDAAQHKAIIWLLLNVPEENRIKLDTKIGMDLDTVIILISNPDLEQSLDKRGRNRGGKGDDATKPLKRRLNKYNFDYLTNLSLEVQLIRRELIGERSVWDNFDRDEKVQEFVTVEDIEIAPHALKGAAMFEVLSRLDNDRPNGFSMIDKALLLDRGYHEREDGERIDKENYEEYIGRPDRNHGIPVTYTRDTIADLVQEHNECIMPRDILSRMDENLDEEPLFSTEEAKSYRNNMEDVTEYIIEEQEDDVIAAIMQDVSVSEDELNEYVEHVYSWGTKSDIVEEPDPLMMKVFEVEYLQFTEDDYVGTDPNEDVVEFREKNVITALGSIAWHSRDDEDFSIDESTIREISVLSSLLSSNEWSDVMNRYENFDPTQWNNPPEDTETEEVKQKCLQNLQNSFGYSEQSARKTARYVINNSDNLWD